MYENGLVYPPNLLQNYFQGKDSFVHFNEISKLALKEIPLGGEREYTVLEFTLELQNNNSFNFHEPIFNTEKLKNILERKSIKHKFSFKIE
jgi:hypothetical protein